MTQQFTIFDAIAAAEAAKRPLFNGADYDSARDDKRLTGQLLRVYEVVKDGNWRSLRTIAAMTGDPEASISAQLRHLRKERFGAHCVERRHVGNGLYEYRVLLETPSHRAPSVELQGA